VWDGDREGNPNGFWILLLILIFGLLFLLIYIWTRPKPPPPEKLVGTIVADGTEQTLNDVTGLMHLSGYVDMQNMTTGDVVVLRQYMRAKSGGEYKKYEEITYRDAQPNPMVYITTKVAEHGIKVTLQQTAGSFKSFDFNFIQEGLT